MAAVTFEVECSTRPGESVVVAGSCDLMGSWNPQNSKVVLETGPNSYPKWASTTQLPSNHDLEFKFVVLGGAGPRWEDKLQANRKLKVASDSLVLAAKFNKSGEQLRAPGQHGCDAVNGTSKPQTSSDSTRDSSAGTESPSSSFFAPPERKGISGASDATVFVPSPVLTGGVHEFAARLGREDANRKSYREKLDLSQTLIKEGAAVDLQNMACLQAYLTFVASGQIKCVEDGRHHRPNHAANASRSMMQQLREIAKRGDAECFIARRIFPSLPSFADQFTCAVPMTRIRDIAHRNDIPHELKQEIKHTLQNKLHRCADPGDLETCKKLVERTRANKQNYSAAFVEQLEIFYVELKEFFNASGLDDMVRKFALTNDETRPVAECFLDAKQKSAKDVQGKMDSLTAFRVQIRPKVADSQEWQLLDLELEKYAFVLLSTWTAELEQSDCNTSLSNALQLALKQLVLSSVCEAESRVLVNELSGATSSPARLKALRMLASSERCIRLCFDLQRRLADAYSGVVSLSSVLPIDKRAVDVFLEAELRASVLFQVSKLSQMLSRSSKKAVSLPDWVAIRPGVAVGRSMRVAALEDVWKLQSRPVEDYLVFCDRASGEEELPPGCKGVVVQRDLPVLSHLAVRARQLGVTFACTAEAALFHQQARFAEGTPLRLTVTSGGDVKVEEVGVQALEAGKIGAAAASGEKPSSPVLGSLNLKEFAVLTAAEANRLTPDSVGAKASSAGRLEALSGSAAGEQDGAFKTPISCAIPFGIMSTVVKGAAFEAALASLERCLATKKADDIEEQAAEVRKAISSLRVDPAVLKAVQKAFPAVVKEVAVRSSANSEDLENVSGAGLHDSVLGVDVRSDDSLERAVLQVWASLFTLRAVQSRHSAGMPLYKGIAMGVLVQQMASLSTQAGNTYAFIMFSEHVAADNPNSVYIELCVGLGETLASASVPGTPYRITVEKQGSRAVNVVSLGSFSHAFVSGPLGVKQSMVDYSLVRLSTDLDFLETLSRRLAAVAVRVEAHYGSGMDIEGVAVEKDGVVDVYLVQARPIVKAQV